MNSYDEQQLNEVCVCGVLLMLSTLWSGTPKECGLVDIEISGGISINGVS